MFDQIAHKFMLCNVVGEDQAEIHADILSFLNRFTMEISK